jgi:hypothetical protein
VKLALSGLLVNGIIGANGGEYSVVAAVEQNGSKQSECDAALTQIHYCITKQIS